MSLLADLAADGDADNESPEERRKLLKQNLETTKKEMKRLERLHEERTQLRFRIDAIDKETEAANAEAAALKKKLAAEQKRQKEEAKNGGGGSGAGPSSSSSSSSRWVDPAKAEPMDPETQGRAIENLKRRRAGLQKLLATLKDPEATLREEDALRQLSSEEKKLERGQLAQVRELALRSKQVEAGRAQVGEPGRGGGGGGGSSSMPEMTAEEREEKEEEYVKRLSEMLTNTRASHDKVKAAADELKSDWDGWFAMLSAAAARLQAKQDAGDDIHFRMPEGQTTPAFKVLELVRDLNARHADLRKRVSDVDASTEAMKAKLQAMTSKIQAQGLALRIDANRAREWKVSNKAGAGGGPGPAADGGGVLLPALT